jgi:L-ascorbate metabolism protein UlaG (beta-lactamase superfamily)
MEITKFGQSCVLIETNDKKILIDPGHYELNDKVKKQWQNVDAIFVTHKHGDHCNSNAIKQTNPNTKIYATNETAKAHPELDFEIVKVGDIITIDKVRVEIIKAVHGFVPSFRGGNEVYEGVGFVVEGEKRVYLVGDSLCFDCNVKCDILFVPICNHGIVMGPSDASKFAKDLNPELVIPYHYDSPNYPGDLNEVKKYFDNVKLNYKILGIGEQIKI